MYFMCKQRRYFIAVPIPLTQGCSASHSGFTPSHHLASEIQHPVLFKLNPQSRGLHLFRATNLSYILVASGVQYRRSGNTCGQKLFSLLLKEALYSYF